MIAQAFKVLAGEGARGNPHKRVRVKQRSGRISYDRGCWQINSYYHPEVSDAQSYDPDFSARKALQIYRGRGNSWSAWCSADVMGLGKSC